jgi:hypothetical protein
VIDNVLLEADSMSESGMPSPPPVVDTNIVDMKAVDGPSDDSSLFSKIKSFKITSFQDVITIFLVGLILFDFLDIIYFNVTKIINNSGPTMQ